MKRIPFVLIAALVTSCGGAAESPTAPSPAAASLEIAPPQTWDAHGPPLTIEEVAPVLAEMLAAVTEDGLRQGSTTPGPGRWTYACPGGGTARIELPDTLPSAGTIAAVDTAVVWTECTMTASATAAMTGRPLSARSTPIVGRGRLSLRLRTWQFWHPVRGPIYTNPNPPTEVQGSLNVNDIGPVPINCATSAASCNGTVGGVTTGAPDTPPPPNPTPAPCTVDGVPVPCPPAPAPTPAPGPAPTPGTGTFSVTPDQLNLGSVSFCPGGGSVEGTITVNAPVGLNWTVELGWSSIPPLSAGLSRTSGTGSGTVMITIRGGALYPPPCLGVNDRTANAIVVRASDGRVAGAVVYFGVSGQTID